jgi:predicted DNA repair protein MutK
LNSRIKSLTVIGTIALLLVSGGIFAHNIDFLHHLLPSIPSIITEFLIGLVVGIVVLAVVELGGFVVKKIKGSKS